jgi:hypothetical protein
MPDQSRRSSRSLVSRSLRVFGRANKAVASASGAIEPCIGCGEETAVGSVFFSDRHQVDRSDGSRVYLCSLCDARVRVSRKGQRLTDEELRSIVENGSMAAITWAGGGR